jgi:adenylate kinase family enzyme
MNLSDSERILILGCSGSGKSTLARKICEKYRLPAIFLDVYFWQPNWIETPQKEWREKVKELVRVDRWVMDGTFSESFDLRFPFADKIIIVNLPRTICLYRAIARVLKYSRIKRRPDMADGCDETFDLGFYKYIWNYNKKVLPQINQAIKDYHCEGKVIYLSSTNEVEKFEREL